MVSCKWVTGKYQKTRAMSFHTWQKEGDLKPQIIFKGMDINHKHETTSYVYWTVHHLDS